MAAEPRNGSKRGCEEIGRRGEREGREAVGERVEGDDGGKRGGEDKPRAASVQRQKAS